jgi:hypothetical protein
MESSIVNTIENLPSQASEPSYQASGKDLSWNSLRALSGASESDLSGVCKL